MCMKKIIQLAKSTMCGKDKEDIYPKTTASAVVAINAKGEEASLDEVFSKKYVVSVTGDPNPNASLQFEDSSVNLGTLISALEDGFNVIITWEYYNMLTSTKIKNEFILTRIFKDANEDISGLEFASFTTKPSYEILVVDADGVIYQNVTNTEITDRVIETMRKGSDYDEGADKTSLVFKCSSSQTVFNYWDNLVKGVVDGSSITIILTISSGGSGWSGLGSNVHFLTLNNGNTTPTGTATNRYPASVTGSFTFKNDTYQAVIASADGESATFTLTTL